MSTLDILDERGVSVAHDVKELRVGGTAFVISGALLLLKSVLDWLVGEPPSTGAELLAWASSQRLLLALINEVLISVAVVLVPAVIVLYRTLHRRGQTLAAAGCGVLAMTIPVLAMVAIIHGRLIYPVYDIAIEDPTAVALVVSIFYGGMHAIDLLLAVAAVTLGLAMRRGLYGRGIAFVGVVAGLLQIVASYPWLVGPVLVWVCHASLAMWLILMGWKLVRLPPLVTTRTAA